MGRPGADRPQRNQVRERTLYVTGGNPILADNTLLFNDMLGNTLGRAENGSYAPVSMTAFGETTDRAAFFANKPAVGDLGYSCSATIAPIWANGRRRIR